MKSEIPAPDDIDEGRRDASYRIFSALKWVSEHDTPALNAIEREKGRRNWKTEALARAFREDDPYALQVLRLRPDVRRQCALLLHGDRTDEAFRNRPLALATIRAPFGFLKGNLNEPDPPNGELPWLAKDIAQDLSLENPGVTDGAVRALLELQQRIATPFGPRSPHTSWERELAAMIPELPNRNYRLAEMSPAQLLAQSGVVEILEYDPVVRDAVAEYMSRSRFTFVPLQREAPKVAKVLAGSPAFREDLGMSLTAGGMQF